MKKYFLYILKSKKDRKFYFGTTQEVKERLVMHNSGRVRSTKSRRPFDLVYIKEFDNKNSARYVEWSIKNTEVGA